MTDSAGGKASKVIIYVLSVMWQLFLKFLDRDLSFQYQYINFLLSPLSFWQIWSSQTVTVGVKNDKNRLENGDVFRN